MIDRMFLIREFSSIVDTPLINSFVNKQPFFLNLSNHDTKTEFSQDRSDPFLLLQFLYPHTSISLGISFGI